MLPIIPVSHFTIKSKYLTQTLTMRPFLVGEETVLLQVKDSEDKVEVMDAIKQVIKQCVIEPKNFDIGDVPSFVVEFIFLRLRQHSNGETSDLTYKCNNQTTEGVCGASMAFTIDLRESTIHEEADHTNLFQVGGGIGVELRYPTINMALNIGNENDVVETLAKSIKSVYTDDEVWLADEYTVDDLKKFVGGMTSKTKNEIQDKFFNKIPKILTVAKPICPSCGYAHTIPLEGIQDHFA